MVTYLRIKKLENELVKQVSKELNKQRMEIEKETMKDSEIFHDVIIKALKQCKVENGELII